MAAAEAAAEAFREAAAAEAAAAFQEAAAGAIPEAVTEPPVEREALEAALADQDRQDHRDRQDRCCFLRFTAAGLSLSTTEVRQEQHRQRKPGRSRR